MGTFYTGIKPRQRRILKPPQFSAPLLKETCFSRESSGFTVLRSMTSAVPKLADYTLIAKTITGRWHGIRAQACSHVEIRAPYAIVIRNGGE